MRTPLATMRIVAESALSAGEGPQRDMALKELLAGMDLCSHLQDQLLTLARLDTSDARLLDQRFAMIEIVDEALLATAAEARAKAQKIQVSVDDAEMVGNRFAVLTLLRNLVANAMRYASREGTVRVTTCRSGLDIQMKVEDDGPGIPPELRERALERFERLNAASGSGAGLGLSIAKSVVTLHGAELQLGQSPLGGLLVEVHFPGRAVPPESDMDIEQHAPPRPRTDAPASESRHRSPQGH
jgi:two-component system sensor histidine kinase QseC